MAHRTQEHSYVYQFIIKDTTQKQTNGRAAKGKGPGWGVDPHSFQSPSRAAAFPTPGQKCSPARKPTEYPLFKSFYRAQSPVPSLLAGDRERGSNPQ